MGSDDHPRPDVEGAVLAARDYGVEIILVGNEAAVGPALSALAPAGLPIRLVHAPDVLTMEDKGMALVLKAKRKEARNSMAVGLDFVRRGEAQAFVTMGNTGAAVTTAYFRLGMLAGIDRPALAPPIPTKHGTCIVLDVGANPDCKPDNLLQFGLMGSIYAERVRGIPRPRVALLSNGEEAGKGSELVRQAYPLLAGAGLNFIGNIEGRDVFQGEVDVTVCDGFAGNVFLKTSEGVARLLMELIRDKIMAGSPLVRLGGALVRPSLQSLRKLLSPSEEGAAPLLGVDGLVFIGHGRSDALAVKNAVRVAKQAVEAGLLDAIRQEVTGRLAAAPVQAAA